jgi:3-dehydroquinate synthase
VKSPIDLERGALQRAASLLDLNRRVFVVTDDGVPSAYAAALAGQCREAAIHVVPQGEQSKSPAVLTALLEAMLRAGLTRGDCVAAVGGGVVGDLAGLAAALYMRGIDWYNIPTTLLAMADSSVGGKTAVDLAGVKNAAGAFWPPRAVLIDPEVLDSLPSRQLSNGLAEAVKMALTHDAALFARFEDPAGYGPVEEILSACLRIKRSVVETDEREAGPRRVLNFGHTLGHGIEAAAGGRLLHGEAVALGMLPMCAPAVRDRLLPVLERLGLPTYVNFDLDMEAALDAIAHDKKSIDGGIEIVTVREIGQFQFQMVSLHDLRPLLQELLLRRRGAQ